MNETPLYITGKEKNVHQLLSGVKYTIDYFQRDYKWQPKNVIELLEDLSEKFLSHYEQTHDWSQVERYGHYFLGSIVISRKEGKNFIVDGQQRLTTITLLLIYLNNLQADRDDRVSIENLIFSERFGQKSFNLDIPERIPCMNAIFSNQDFDTTDQPESITNIIERYKDIEENFPDDLTGDALPYFIEWLKYNVDLVEITAYSDEDAYTIFETMNDRGLSLSPTDMLKGYLLSFINNSKQRDDAHSVWKRQIMALLEIGKEEETDFFKTWFRAKYADSIRERKKGAVNRDFEVIGTAFHKWVRDESGRIGLKNNSDFYNFITREQTFFSKYYIRLRQASNRFTPGLEYVYYNARHNFTLQYPLILASLRQADDPDTIDRKIRLVSGFIDIFIARRIWNFRTLAYSSIVYTMFTIMRDIRNKDVPELIDILHRKLRDTTEDFSSTDFRMHQQNGRQVHQLLARLTYHIEQESGVASRFSDYVSRQIKKPFEIEHIWANKFERHQDEFAHPAEFLRYRNRIGGLILLPRGFNQSLGDDTYETKVRAYFGQNLLAKTLSEQCYQNNPSFLAYRQCSGLPFRSHSEFKKSDLDARQQLYRRICEEIWNPDRLDKQL
jgi:uncharacterized protein with ParB-like and HNH nuclease domain